MKQELSIFLRTELKLTLSDEKTKITHLNDGFEFLGFRILRCRAAPGLKTKILIQPSAISVSGPAVRMSQYLPTIKTAVHEAAQTISFLLGSPEPPRNVAKSISA
jgi:hypothetical protein